jgi:hypothetical protein
MGTPSIVRSVRHDSEIMTDGRPLVLIVDVHGIVVCKVGDAGLTETADLAAMVSQCRYCS